MLDMVCLGIETVFRSIYSPFQFYRIKIMSRMATSASTCGEGEQEKFSFRITPYTYTWNTC